jgi:sugar phosphate permease
MSKSFAYHRNATFVSLLVGYASYYLCRQNLSAAYGPMRDALGIDTVQFGWISSFGTLLYAIGKVSTGSWADSKRGGRAVFFLGLFCSAVFSVIFGLGSGIAFFLAIWGLNRFFQSMGWGGLVNVMARWFPSENYGTAMGFMAISYQFGGVLASLYAGLILSLGGGWRSLFFIPGITLAVVGLVAWHFIINSPADVGYALPVHAPTEGDKPAAAGNVASDENTTYLQRFGLLLRDRAFLLMLALSFILTFLRECFNTWMPAFFSEMGASASVAAFKSAIFPLLGCAGTLFAGWFSDKYLSGRRGPVMAGLMVFLVISLLALGHLETVASAVGLERSTAAMVLVGVVGFFLLGPYSLVGGVVALDFGGRRTAGTAAGLLDGIGYLAATLSGVGIAKVLVQSGWGMAYSAMAFLTVVAILLCGLLWQVRPRAAG